LGGGTCGINNGVEEIVDTTSDRWHWHQKLIVAVAKTAASKVSLRLRLALRALRWARVMGEHLGWQAARGLVSQLLVSPVSSGERHSKAHH